MVTLRTQQFSVKALVSPVLYMSDKKPIAQLHEHSNVAKAFMSTSTSNCNMYALANGCCYTWDNQLVCSRLRDVHITC